ncbi:DUF6463 family protein [Nonomuraea roseoviolacea]|uniref:Uncharacterized protein n=1 Tax=Nonomuraea roseoviolacea subsp. carminata TaxID=160689 RepID=A0ABT1KFP6_9ACTN|nr:DUF6463 family protein [Nonomuraea roseoviolacea]MCP2352850.1 hypothetical protein [Nonomuraea roseoviolacea subsp. carminata]
MTTTIRPRAGLHRWVPRLTLAAATVHMAVGAVASAPQWRDILSGGLWNTVANDDHARMTALWFMVAGVALFGLGLLAREAVIGTGALPAEMGWTLMAAGVLVSALEPASGGWLLIVIGALALVATRDRHRAPCASAGDR